MHYRTGTLRVRSTFVSYAGGGGWANRNIDFACSNDCSRTTSNNGRVIIFAGGIPLKRNGKVVGGVGGSGKQDRTVAEAGAAALQ